MVEVLFYGRSANISQIELSVNFLFYRYPLTNRNIGRTKVLTLFIRAVLSGRRSFAIIISDRNEQHYNGKIYSSTVLQQFWRACACLLSFYWMDVVNIVSFYARSSCQLHLLRERVKIGSLLFFLFFAFLQKMSVTTFPLWKQSNRRLLRLLLLLLLLETE